MGIFSSTNKTRSTTSVDLKNPDKDEKALLKNQLALANEQIRNFERLGNFNDQVFLRELPNLAKQANKFLGREDQITSESLGFSRNAIGAQKGLLRDALAQIDRGVELTDQQAANIKDAADNAISSGGSDIAAFRDDGLRQLVQEQSIARGLRPEDTPIGDVGGRIVKDANREYSELVDSVRSQEATARLQYPIQAGNYTAGLIGQQQGIGTTNQAFINQLRQDAFNNRLNLISTGGNLGNNTARIGANPDTLGGLQTLRFNSSSKYGTGTEKGSPGIISTLVGAAQGAGEAYTAFNPSQPGG